jgi:hypothetical protein
VNSPLLNPLVYVINNTPAPKSACGAATAFKPCSPIAGGPP